MAGQFHGAQYGFPQVMAYTAAKPGGGNDACHDGGTVSLFEISVNCIARGFTATAMSSGATDDDPDRRQEALGRRPLGAFGEPKDITETACLFPLTPRSILPELYCRQMA